MYSSPCSIEILFSVCAARPAPLPDIWNRYLPVGYVGISRYPYFAIPFATFLLELNYADHPLSNSYQQRLQHVL